jgi:hypothetical protein
VMSRVFFVALAAVCALLVLSATAAASSSRPSVRPVERNPLVVRVAHFKPKEQVVVRVVVRGAGRFAKTATTGVRGGLNMRFASLTLGQCNAFTIIAVGSRGSRATFAGHPPPCGPAP